MSRTQDRMVLFFLLAVTPMLAFGLLTIDGSQSNINEAGNKQETHELPSNGINVIQASNDINRRNASNNLFIGTIGSADRQLFRQNLYVPGRKFFIARKTVRYPNYWSPSNRTISAIRIYDLIQNGTGGYPRVQNGGIWQKHVTLSFTSQRSHSMYFNIEIYGH